MGSLWEIFWIMKQELALTASIIVLLVLKLAFTLRSDQYMTAAYGLLVLIVLVGITGTKEGRLFNDMFVQTEMRSLLKSFLSLGVLLIALSAAHWLRNHEHVPEFFMLMLSALLGMFFLISSGHLLMFFLSLELATLPVAALCNFDLHKRIASEAAMKLVMLSAFASAVLLLGIALIYGITGTMQLDQLAQHMHLGPWEVVAFVLILSSFAFKMSVVPFHLWTADVYEGAPVSITAFLSVISKGTVAFVLLSVLYTVFSSLADVWHTIIAVLAIVTMSVGNLFALRQHNVKRLLAFSSIAQVGFILFGISGHSPAGIAAVVYFILIYLFSNIAAFAVVEAVSAATGKERLEDLRGLYYRNPRMSWVFILALLSLAGIPPTAGFFGKFFLLMAGAASGNYVLLILAVLNMVVALYYYLRVVRYLFLDTEQLPATVPSGWAEQVAWAVCVVGILITGIFDGAYRYIFSLI